MLPDGMAPTHDDRKHDASGHDRGEYIRRRKTKPLADAFGTTRRAATAFTTTSLGDQARRSCITRAEKSNTQCLTKKTLVTLLHGPILEFSNSGVGFKPRSQNQEEF
jgi:hypothetical protein